MTHVFLLVLLLGDVPVKGPPMYFASIDRCNYFASQLAKRYGNYGSYHSVPKEHKATAYCKPKFVDLDKTLVYD